MRTVLTFATITLALMAVAQTERGNQRYGSAPRADGTLDLAMQWNQGRAVGKGPARFTHSPMQLEDIKSIVPYGHPSSLRIRRRIAQQLE